MSNSIPSFQTSLNSVIGSLNRQIGEEQEAKELLQKRVEELETENQKLKEKVVLLPIEHHVWKWKEGKDEYL